MNIQQVSYLPSFEAKVVGVDIETTTSYGKDSDYFRDRIISVQVSDGETVWVLQDNFVSLIPMLVNPEIKKISHNAIFDFSFLNYKLGIESVNLYDTLVVERVLNSGRNMAHDLATVLAYRFGVFLKKSVRSQFADHIGTLTQEQLEYAAADAYYLPKLREVQLQDISKFGLGRIVALENSIIPVFVDMTLTGVGFDRDLWREHEKWIERYLEEAQIKMAGYLGVMRQPSLFGGVGWNVNLNSRDQVIDLCKQRGIELPNTKKSTLLAMAQKYDDPFLPDLIDYKKWQKMKEWGNPKHVNPVTGRIHTKWNPVKADTGRMSSSRPAIQNVKRPDKNQPNFRHLFIPKPGYKFIVADFAQQEIRILADLSQDEALIAATQAGDIYGELATRVYNRPITKKDHERFLMKTGFLADVYGASPMRLAMICGRPENEMREFQKVARGFFPKAYRWGSAQISAVANRGFTSTTWGRRRYYPGSETIPPSELEKRFGREARNMPIQGTAADISKQAMAEFWKAKTENDWDAHIVLMIHDEMVVEVKDEIAEEMKYQVVGSMRSAMESVCPHIVAGVDAEVLDKWSKI